MTDAFGKEIKELELTAADIITKPDMRYICRVKALLLRNGYRLQEIPWNARLLEIMNLQTLRSVYTLSVLELRLTKRTPEDWLKLAKEEDEN